MLRFDKIKQEFPSKILSKKKNTILSKEYIIKMLQRIAINDNIVTALLACGNS
jgi:hypothetical protein